MELRFLPPLAAFEINLLLGLFALANLRRGKFYPFFAAFALAAALWCGAMASYFVLPHALREMALRVAFAGGCAVPLIYLTFARSRAGRPLSRRSLLSWGLFAGGLSGMILVHPFLTDHLRWALSQVEVVFLAAYLCVAYAISFWSLRGAAVADRSREDAFIIHAAALPFAAMLLYMAGGLLVSGHSVSSNVLIPVVVGAEAMLYFGVRFGKVEVSDMLSRGLLYLVYTVILTGFLFIGLFILSRAFGFSVTIWDFMGLLAFCLVSAYAFMASRARIEQWIDRTFFPEKVEYRNMIRRYEEELKDAREQLYRNERLAMLGELSARIAHEIRNPLGPIKGYSQMLSEAMADGPVPVDKLKKAVEIITEEADKIDRRLTRFLDLARRERQARQAVDLHGLIDKTAELIKSGPGMAIERDYRAAAPVREIDPAQVQGALFNIMQNAAQAMGGKGRITLRTNDDDGSLVIEVQDSGPGIDPEIMPRMFDPFVSGRPGGTGLGLLVAKNLMESNGASIFAENRREGALFRIVFHAGPNREG